MAFLMGCAAAGRVIFVDDIASASRAAPATSKTFTKSQLTPTLRLVPEPAGPCKGLRDEAVADFAGMVFGSAIFSPRYSFR